jgi:two-component system, response regulator
MIEKPTILLIDDNPDDIDLTIRALRKNNISSNLVVKMDSLEALAYLFGTGNGTERKPHAAPHFILLDLKMPKIDGFQILRQIRGDERTRSLPIVVLSTSNEARDLIECYRLGANSYICKPMDFVTFSELIGHIGNYWLRINHPPPLRSESSHEY